MGVFGGRTDYGKHELDERTVDRDPIRQFLLWYREAESAGLTEPSAACLATADAGGRPSARVVLVRGVDERGFCFYTNHESRKGRELAANPRAALVFYWAEQERQVRVEGEVVFTSDAESDEYFHSRPVGSRIGAWASNQSDVIADRSVLEEAWHTYEKEYPNGDPPRPPHWGGYRLLPDLVEFWQGRSSRLHDRVRYRREGSDWLVERLAP